MKISIVLKMTLIALILGVSFTSCSKEDNDEPQATEKKLVKMTVEHTSIEIDASISYIFSYDTDGRLQEATINTILPDYINTHRCKYVWNTHSIDITDEESPNSDLTSELEQLRYTMHISDGLVRALTYEEYPSDNVSFNYDKSNRLQHTTDGSSNIYCVWGNDKLISITENSISEESFTTFTYGESLPIKGYFPLVPYTFAIDPLFVAYPELIGTKTSQIFASITYKWTDTPDQTSTCHLENEFDKYGYISKVISENKRNGDYVSKTIYTFIWE